MRRKFLHLVSLRGIQKMTFLCLADAIHWEDLLYTRSFLLEKYLDEKEDQPNRWVNFDGNHLVWTVVRYDTTVTRDDTTVPRYDATVPRYDASVPRYDTILYYECN